MAHSTEERCEQVDEQELITRYQAGERDFSRADLGGTDLSGADLNKAFLFRANLRKANLSGADLNRVNLFDSFQGSRTVPVGDVVNAAVSRLPDWEIAELARRIVRLERELESYFRQVPSPPHTPSTE